MFSENSMLVKSWVRLIESGAKAWEDVPNLFNLQEAVAAVLAETN